VAQGRFDVAALTGQEFFAKKSPERFMKPTSADSQNESRVTPWPSVLRIISEEFKQSVAVAQLAVKLCELKVQQSKIPLERQNLDPNKFVPDAWDLIQNAREHVFRPKTDVEHLVENKGTNEAVARVIGRRHESSRIPFQQLCNPKPEKDPITFCGIQWKVYRSERGRGFDDLFWDYWRNIGEKWKRGDQEIGTLTESDSKGKSRRVNFYSKSEREELAKLARDAEAWKERGQQMLDSWKRHGMPPQDFLTVAKFRKERDNKRVTNLKKKPK
jgi:hypothetical protein